MRACVRARTGASSPLASGGRRRAVPSRLSVTCLVLKETIG